MADHEIIDAAADALPGVGGVVAKLGVAIEDAIFKKVDEAQDKANDLLATVQQVNDTVKQINNPATSADNQFVATQKALGEAGAQGHGLVADLQASSALQAASREAENARTDMDARHKAAHEVTERQSELKHAKDILTGYGSDADILQKKQDAAAAADKDEGIILEHDDLQRRIADAKGKVEADTRSHDVDAKALARDLSLVDGLNQQADRENSGYLKAKQQLPGEENQRALADKNWSDLEGAKNLITQLANAVAAAQQKLGEINSSQTSAAQSADAVTGSIQTLQQSFQTYHQTIMDALNRFNATVQQMTVDIQNLQHQQSNHGP